MRRLGQLSRMVILAAGLAACGDATDVTGAAGTVRFDGGGTYGSGGDLMPAEVGSFTPTADEEGGGTYGSGGRIASTTSTCESDEERGGGTYGSGGRMVECFTEPTP